MEHPEASCTCSSCVNACRRNPGWFSPDEAERALNAGMAGRMMLDWWVMHPKNIYILAPASLGHEGTMAPECTAKFYFEDWYKGRCTFLNNKDRCDIHDSGFKPLECRTFVDNSEIQKLWDNKRGRSLVARWRKETGE